MAVTRLLGPDGKKVGRDIFTEMLDPPALNEEEAILDIERRKVERKKMYEQNNDVGMKFFFDIFMDTRDEQRLRERYGDRYENEPFYQERLKRIREGE